MGGHLQGGVPQPPVLHRALPGRGHRRRGHRARHHGHGRAPGGGDGPVAVRRGRRTRHPPCRRRRRPRRRWVRQLARPAEHRRRDGVRRVLRGQPAGQCALRGSAAQGRSAPGVRVGDREQDHPVRCAHRTRRHRRRVRAGVGHVRRRRKRSERDPARDLGRSCPRCRSATRSWRRCSSSAASSCMQRIS